MNRQYEHMFDHARYRRAVRRAWRALPENYGHRATGAIILFTRSRLAAGYITELDAEDILDRLATGDPDALAEHPAYNDDPDELYWVEPDGTRTSFYDPRVPRPAQRMAAIDDIAEHALKGTPTVNPAVALLDHVRTTASEGKKWKTHAELSRAALARARGRNHHPRGPDRLERSVSRDVAALVSAARPGPFTGVAPVSV